jgi:hypothetical protein
MYIPDNNDVYSANEREADRILRQYEGVSADEARADNELPWVTVPDDYGRRGRSLYFEEE